jgi:hypothetical protein
LISALSPQAASPDHSSVALVGGSAAIQYFHWDKPHHGDRGNVTALDLASRRVVAIPVKNEMPVKVEMTWRREN